MGLSQPAGRILDVVDGAMGPARGFPWLFPPVVDNSFGGPASHECLNSASCGFVNSFIQSSPLYPKVHILLLFKTMSLLFASV